MGIEGGIGEGQSSHTVTMNTALTLSFFALVLVSYSQAARVFFLDDGDLAVLPHSRVRRDTPPSYGPPAPSYSAPHKSHGRVGPVYTFVKTDPQANFKWGVRHRA